MKAKKVFLLLGIFLVIAIIVLAATTNTFMISDNGIGVTSTDAVVIQNNTAASTGAPQWSPRFRLMGSGFNTARGGGTLTDNWVMEDQAISAASPTQAAGWLTLSYGQGGATPTSVLSWNPSNPTMNLYAASNSVTPTIAAVSSGSNVNGSNFTLIAGNGAGGGGGGTINLQGGPGNGAGLTGSVQVTGLQLLLFLPSNRTVMANGLKALTNNSIVTFVKTTFINSSDQIAGTITYMILDTNATNRSTIGGVVAFSATNISGTISCLIGTGGTGADPNAALSGNAAGFLNSFSCSDAGSNVLNLSAKALTTGGTDTLAIQWLETVNGNVSTVIGQ